MGTQTPREIAFEDIRAGDRLRVEHAWAGIEFTREGVAHENTRDGWFTSEDGLLITADSTATITLLHRPAPAEPKGLGAVVRARVSRSTVDPRRARTLVCVGGAWVDEQDFRQSWRWSDFDPESIEVLSEGIEVEL